MVAVKVFSLETRGAQKSFIAECNALRNVLEPPRCTLVELGRTPSRYPNHFPDPGGGSGTGGRGTEEEGASGEGLAVGDVLGVGVNTS